MPLHLTASEETRFERIERLLSALDSYTDLRAAVLLALTDDETPNDRFRTLADAGLPISASARTEQLFAYAAPRLGLAEGKKVDREQRDYVFPQLGELGLIERSYVLSAAEAKQRGRLIEFGVHVPKSSSNCYVLSHEARDLLLESPVDQWEDELTAFVHGTEERRLRLLQRESAAAAVGTTHAALIRAAADALQAEKLRDFELVYVDDADGDRIRPEWEQKLQPLNLMPSLETPFPDAILVNESSRSVWFVDAVVSDGEIDEFRAGELQRFAESRGYSVAGHTTAYETWQRAAARQARMKNLAVGSTVWIAEDGGKLFAVDGLAG